MGGLLASCGYIHSIYIYTWLKRYIECKATSRNVATARNRLYVAVAIYRIDGIATLYIQPICSSLHHSVVGCFPAIAAMVTYDLRPHVRAGQVDADSACSVQAAVAGAVIHLG